MWVGSANFSNVYLTAQDLIPRTPSTGQPYLRM